MTSPSSVPDLYEVLTVSSESVRLKYAVVIITIGISLVSYLSPYLKAGHLLAFSVMTTVIPLLYSVWKNSTTTFIKDMDFRLSTIDPDDKYNYMYMDANLVNLLYSIYDFKTIAPETYERLLEMCNSLLHLRSDFDTGLLADMTDQYANAEVLGSKAINQLHTFIYSITNPTVYKLYNTAFQRFRIIIRRQLDEMRSMAIAKPLPNGRMPFILAPEAPKALPTGLYEDDAERAFNVVV